MTNSEYRKRKTKTYLRQTRVAPFVFLTGLLCLIVGSLVFLDLLSGIAWHLWMVWQ